MAFSGPRSCQVNPGIGPISTLKGPAKHRRNLMSGLGRAVRMNASRVLPEVDDAIRGRARSRARMCARKPCKRQSPRQDRSFGHKLEDADRRWESKPRSRTPRQRLSPRPTAFRSSHELHSNQAIGHPDENQSGRTRGVEATCGPGKAEMPIHPSAGTNLRRAEESRSAAGRERKEGGIIVRQGRGCLDRVAEHRADKGRDGA